MVGVVKEILSKALTEGEDPHLALQAYRATPFDSSLKSPAEMLYARPLRTQIPVRTCLTAEQQAARDIQQEHKSQQKVHYDRTARDYKNLTQQQQVRVQLDPHKRLWTNATVIDLPTKEFPRSYIVQTENGAQYQRNRRWIKPRTLPIAASDTATTTGIQPTEASPIVSSDEAESYVTTANQDADGQTAPFPRRSSRSSKGQPPDRLVL